MVGIINQQPPGYEANDIRLGAANYKGEIVFAAEGQGADVASELIVSKLLNMNKALLSLVPRTD